MNRKFLFFILAYGSIFASKADLAHRAFCTVPIADVVSRPLANPTATREQVRAAYKNIPVSWGPHTLDKIACPRIHQLLLHETVNVLDETEHEALVEIPHFTTLSPENNLEPIKGWILKEHITNIDAGNIRHVPASHLPARNLVLSQPLCDLESCYSAGTFFVAAHPVESTLESGAGENYHAWAYDSYLKKFKIIEIQKNICLTNTQTLSLKEKKELFCKIITTWATRHPLFIPLVWGGASVAKAWEPTDYTSTNVTDETGNTRNVWDRPKYGNETHQGIDASNLVARAAQIVGIKYEYRNTATAAAELDELYMYEWPENGDLIWIPGGLLIINDLTGNRAVTAFSYGAGYGIVTELPLARIFKDISTYEDFMTAYRAHQPLTILNKDGSTARTITEYKILRFARN